MNCNFNIYVVYSLNFYCAEKNIQENAAIIKKLLKLLPLYHLPPTATDSSTTKDLESYTSFLQEIEQVAFALEDTSEAYQSPNEISDTAITFFKECRSLVEKY